MLLPLVHNNNNNDLLIQNVMSRILFSLKWLSFTKHTPSQYTYFRGMFWSFFYCPHNCNQWVKGQQNPESGSERRAGRAWPGWNVGDPNDNIRQQLSNNLIDFHTDLIAPSALKGIPAKTVNQRRIFDILMIFKM